MFGASIVTTELIQGIAEQIVNEQLLSNWRFYLLIVGLSFVGGALGNFAWAYFSTRGKALATKADWENILKQVSQTTSTTENIKSNIQRSSWRSQKRWELKSDIYWQLLKLLSQYADALGGFRVVIFDDNKKLRSKDKLDSKRFKELADRRVVIDKEIDEIRSVAGLVLSAEAIENIFSIKKRLKNAADDSLHGYEMLEVGEQALRDMADEIAEAARKDLLEEE